MITYRIPVTGITGKHTTVLPVLSSTSTYTEGVYLFNLFTDVTLKLQLGIRCYFERVQNVRISRHTKRHENSHCKKKQQPRRTKRHHKQRRYIYIASTINTQTYYHEHSLPSLLLEGCETTIVGIPYTGNDEGCCYVW